MQLKRQLGVTLNFKLSLNSLKLQLKIEIENHQNFQFLVWHLKLIKIPKQNKKKLQWSHVSFMIELIVTTTLQILERITNTFQYFENLKIVLILLKFKKKFKNIITLSEIKSDKKLSEMLVVKKGQRLSIQPVDPKHFEILISKTS